MPHTNSSFCQFVPSFLWGRVTDPINTRINLSNYLNCTKQTLKSSWHFIPKIKNVCLISLCTREVTPCLTLRRADWGHCTTNKDQRWIHIHPYTITTQIPGPVTIKHQIYIIKIQSHCFFYLENNKMLSKTKSYIKSYMKQW